MEFRTVVDTPKMPFLIEPQDELLFVGSCFADAIGRRFAEQQFRATVNPYGVMYNPASILHTIRRYCSPATEAGGCPKPRVAFLTLGTNHVYRLKETGEIVDNCQKRPAALFSEEQLTVDACADYLRQAIDMLCRVSPQVHIVLTVSPIRYRKYGYHGSQLSKATLLLAADKVIRETGEADCRPMSVSYFPAYEIVNDELRDYRFYADDMLHPSAQAVDYVWERLADCCFSKAARTFMAEWRPIWQALNHRPLHPDTPDYQAFQEKTRQQLAAFKQKYPHCQYPLPAVGG